MSKPDFSQFNLADVFKASLNNLTEMLRLQRNSKDKKNIYKTIDDYQNKPEQLINAFQYMNIIGNSEFSSFIQDKLPNKDETFNSPMSLSLLYELFLNNHKDEKSDEKNTSKTKGEEDSIINLDELKNYQKSNEIKDFIEVKIPYVIQAAIGGNIDIFKNVYKYTKQKSLNIESVIGLTNKQKNAFTSNILGAAIYYNNSKMVKYILDNYRQEIDLNFKSIEKKGRRNRKTLIKEFTGYTPFLLALISPFSSDKETIILLQILFSTDIINPNVKEANGENCLHIAARCGKLCSTKFLIESKKLDNLLSETNRDGITPLTLAKNLGANEMYEYYRGLGTEKEEEIEKNIKELLEGEKIKMSKRKGNKSRKINTDEIKLLGSSMFSSTQKDNNWKKTKNNDEKEVIDSKKLRQFFGVEEEKKSEAEDETEFKDEEKTIEEEHNKEERINNYDLDIKKRRKEKYGYKADSNRNNKIKKEHINNHKIKSFSKYNEEYNEYYNNNYKDYSNYKDYNNYNDYNYNDYDNNNDNYYKKAYNYEDNYNNKHKNSNYNNNYNYNRFNNKYGNKYIGSKALEVTDDQIFVNKKWNKQTEENQINTSEKVIETTTSTEIIGFDIRKAKKKSNKNK